MQLWTLVDHKIGSGIGILSPTAGGSVGNVGPSSSTLPALLGLWQYTEGGNLLSAINANWALTGNGDRNAVTIQPLQSNDPNQIWMKTGDRVTPLINLGSSQTSGYPEALNMPSSTNAAAVLKVWQPSVDWQQFQVAPRPFDNYYLLTTIYNNTQNGLYVNGAATEGASALSATMVPLAAGAYFTFWSLYQSGLENGVQIWDSQTASDSVASFVLKMSFTGGVSFAATNFIQNYTLSNAQTSSTVGDEPGTASITVNYN